MDILTQLLNNESFLSAVAVAIAGTLGWLTGKTKSKKDDEILKKAAEKILEKE